MNIGIIGGGMTGISLGYYLSRLGVKVEIFEASPTLGGLAGNARLEDGTIVDRFYHTILTSDRSLMQLCSELGITDQLRFHETKTGFYYNQALYSMNNLVEFFQFPPLGWVDRFRLGLTILYSQQIRDWRKLDTKNVEDWLVRLSGRRTFENIWRPMLRAKFDGSFDTTPATYIWSRLVRMKSTRSGVNQKEQAGHLIGGYGTLLKAMADGIESAGGAIHLNCPVHEIVIDGGKVRGIRTAKATNHFDIVIGTLPVPLFSELLPGRGPEWNGYLKQVDYLGVITVLLALDRPLTPYWTVNITDNASPFTGVIETTSYIDPAYVGGYHLVYLPKYTTPNSTWQSFADEDVIEIWLEYLQKMFPDFDRSWIRHCQVQRELFVEPLHYVNDTDLIPDIDTPLKNLFYVSTAQVYPDLTNGESIVRFTRRAADTIRQHLN